MSVPPPLSSPFLSYTSSLIKRRWKWIFRSGLLKYFSSIYDEMSRVAVLEKIITNFLKSFRKKAGVAAVNVNRMNDSNHVNIEYVRNISSAWYGVRRKHFKFIDMHIFEIFFFCSCSVQSGAKRYTIGESTFSLMHTDFIIFIPLIWNNGLQLYRITTNIPKNRNSMHSQSQIKINQRSAFEMRDGEVENEQKNYYC